MKGGEPIRVLHFIPCMCAAGIENFIMNLYRNIDRTKIQFDFVVHTTKKQIYDNEIKQLGGKIYYLSYKDDKNLFKYIRDLHNLFAKHPEYKIVHGNMQSMMPLYLYIAKKHSVPVRIAHSHISHPEKSLKGVLLYIISRFSKTQSNVHLACSDEAGRYLFRKNDYTVTPNAIDAARFKFDNHKRIEIRKQLHINANDTLIGHVGRFAASKNHQRLINIFNNFKALHPTAKLCLLGEGKEEDKIRKKVQKMGLANSVIFLQVRKNTEAYYSAMDIFLFPSLYEGLPMACIEAQTSGLPCILSSSITHEADITSNLSFLSLQKHDNEWTKHIDNVIINKPNRKAAFEKVSNSAFNVRISARKSEKLYQELLKKNQKIQKTCNSKPLKKKYIQNKIKSLKKILPAVFILGLTCEIAAEMCYTIPGVNQFLKILNLFGLTLLFIYDIFTIHKKNLFIFICLTSLSIITFLSSTSTIPLKISLLIFAVQSFTFYSTVNLDFKVRIILFIAIILLTSVGIIDNAAVPRPDGSMRYTLGFAHPNTLGIYSTILVIERFYLDYKKNIHKFCNVVIAITVCVFNLLVTESRAAIILLFLVTLTYSMPHNLLKTILKPKFLAILIQYSFLIFSVMTLCIVVIYNSNSEFGNSLNMMLSHRPMYYNAFLKKYNITLFGANVPDKFHIYVLDNSFILIILRFGLIQYLLYLILSVKTFKRLFKNEEYFLAIILMSTLAYGIMESSAIRPSINVFILLLSSGLSRKNHQGGYVQK